MRPRRVPTTDTVFRLAGGNEDNDLWVERGQDEEGYATITSVWEPDALERSAIAHGATIELTVWGRGTPPVAMRVGRSLEERKEAT